jgi:hypothetical protein
MLDASPTGSQVVFTIPMELMELLVGTAPHRSRVVDFLAMDTCRRPSIQSWDITPSPMITKSRGKHGAYSRETRELLAELRRRWRELWELLAAEP